MPLFPTVFVFKTSLVLKPNIQMAINSPPDNRNINMGQFKKGQSEPILPIYCASRQVHTEDCSVLVLRDKRIVPAQGDLF